jgi:hypothetical protein
MEAPEISKLNENHLQGLTLEEEDFIRKLAKLTADIILKDYHKKIHSMNQNS